MIDSYEIELLFTQDRFEAEHIVAALERALGDEATVEPHPGELARVTEVLAHAAAPLPEWRVSRPRLIRTVDLADALQQSWWWPEARGAVSAARYAIRVSDRHNRTTDFRRRLEFCQRIAVALIRELAPVGVNWMPSQQLLEPGQLAAAFEQDGFGTPLPGGLNVRFFQLEYDAPGADQEFLMDTVGLNQLGLADLQCHFRGLDPEDVSRTLYETGCYQYEHGRVMGDGDTVQGPKSNDLWSCTHVTALAAPERGVIDLDPGFPFAAGKEIE